MERLHRPPRHEGLEDGATGVVARPVDFGVADGFDAPAWYATQAAGEGFFEAAPADAEVGLRGTGSGILIVGRGLRRGGPAGDTRVGAVGYEGGVGVDVGYEGVEVRGRIGEDARGGQGLERGRGEVGKGEERAAAMRRARGGIAEARGGG